MLLLDIVQAEGAAGTAFVFDGLLWHAGGANRTDSPCIGMITNRCGPSCRPIENYTREMRPEVLARCLEEIRKRLGFETWNAYGYTGELVSSFVKDTNHALGELHH